MNKNKLIALLLLLFFIASGWGWGFFDVTLIKNTPTPAPTRTPTPTTIDIPLTVAQNSSQTPSTITVTPTVSSDGPVKIAQMQTMGALTLTALFTPYSLTTNTPSATTVTIRMARLKKDVKIISGPGVGYYNIVQYPKGKWLEVLGKNADEDWYQIWVTETTTDSYIGTGWAAVDAFDCFFDMQSLPVIPNPPTPTIGPTLTRVPARPTSTRTLTPGAPPPPPLPPP